MKWTSPASPNANPLRYGNVYNFYFKANIAPQANVSTLKLFKAPVSPSTLTELKANTMLPPDPNIYASVMTPEFGTLTGGTLADLKSSDNVVVTVTENQALDQSWQASLNVDGTSPILSPSKLEFFVETRADRNGRHQFVQFWNYNTSTWDTIDSSTLGTSDVAKTITVTGAANTNKYINSTTKAVKARILLGEGDQDTATPVKLFADVARWKVTF